VLDRHWLDLAAHPQAGDQHTGLESGEGLGFQLMRGGSGMLVGHTGSMPGFLAACFADRGRRTGAVVLSNATTGLLPGHLARDLLELLEDGEPTLAPAWLPTSAVPEALAGALGVWHWGNTAYVAALEGDGLSMSRDGVVMHRFEVDGDRVVGTVGYHAGETLHVVRRDDGSVSHLECATFVYTRTPYDPDAPIPGGRPRRS
jgi:D-alanyl-D-alanine carboxypeptidase